MLVRHLLIAKNCSFNFLESLKFEEQELVVTHAQNIEDFQQYFKENIFDVVLFDLDFVQMYQNKIIQIFKTDTRNAIPFIVLNESKNKENSLCRFIREEAVAILQTNSDQDEMTRCFNVAFRLRDLSDKIEKIKEGTFRNRRTGLYESSYLEDRLTAEFKRAERYVFGLSVVLISFKIDPSDFFNKAHQYALWEEKTSEMLLRFTRTNDIVVGTSPARFLLLFPDTNKKGAEIFANRFLDAVLKFDWRKELNAKFSMTTSMGIASFPEDGVRKETALLELADKALEQALKSEGNTIYSFEGMNVTGLFPGNIRQVKPER